MRIGAWRPGHVLAANDPRRKIQIVSTPAPAGLFSDVSENDASTRSRAIGWEAVVEVLDELCPDWWEREFGTGIECAVSAIRNLARSS